MDGSLKGKPLSGGLYVWPKNRTEWPNWEAIESIKRYDGPIKNWNVVELHSEKPLLGEDDTMTSEPFRYVFLVRESENHLLIVTSKSELLPVFQRQLRLSFVPQNPQVHVAKLVDRLTHPRHHQYAFSQIYAKVDGDGISLRTISLFGSDIGGSGLYQLVSDKVSAYRVEIRDLATSDTLMSIGTRGEVSFWYNSNLSLTRVEDTLRFLNQDWEGSGAFLEWPDDVL